MPSEFESNEIHFPKFSEIQIAFLFQTILRQGGVNDGRNARIFSGAIIT
jgi:hypothetical protein